ncbi:hypothetical protein [Streptomyces subrutilus]|uniref:hypothetical protein n=1 Tax=Streptomyces subrutilus TaxID=36818 RepID=UPI002E12DC22|nr:hypothetical protein OG479_30665 [Streptomyces subrutilus]
MNTGVRITAFAAALAAAFAAAYGVGRGVGPAGAPAAPEHAGHAAQARPGEQGPAAGGLHEAFAHFEPSAPGAERVTPGADLSVPGAYAPNPLPPPAEAANYREAPAGTLDPGTAGEPELTVSKDGRPVTDLEPYLGAYGHLVALRDRDQAHLHVHPNEGGPGPEVSFTATAPGAGSYRLFPDFRHGSTVRTAAFTVRAGTATAAAPEPARTPSSQPPASGGGESSGDHSH